MPAWHLRPRSAAEAVDAAIQLLRHHARPLLLLSAILVIPGMLLGLVNALLVGNAFTPTRPGAMPNVSGTAIATLVPLVIVYTCWFLVAFGALVGAAASAYVDGHAPEPAEALRRVRSRVGVLLGSGWLTYLLVLVQFLALAAALAIVLGIGVLAVSLLGGAARGGAGIAGGVFAAVFGLATFVGFIASFAWLIGRYVTLPAVAALESLPVGATMRRARELSRGSTRRIALLLLLVGVLFAVVTIGAMLLLAALLRSQVAGSVLANVFNVPLYAFAGALVAVLYYDLRVRHEGLDIELLAGELGAEPVAVGPSGA